MLGNIAQQARDAGQRIFPLSFHVDYWNYLGWTDPFSDAAYSRRQETYARKLAVHAYTPQMIVNGTDVFVGSDAEKAHATIRRALRRPAAVGLALQAETAAGYLQIAYEVGAVPKTAVLHLALVERDLTTEVLRGENSGRTLSHDNVVRWFETLQLDAGTQKPIRIKMPAVSRNKSAVIGYVQDLASMAILGAATVSLAP